MNKDYENSHALAAKFLKEDGTIVGKLPVEAELNVGNISIDMTSTNKLLEEIKDQNTFALKERDAEVLMFDNVTKKIETAKTVVSIFITCKVGVATITFSNGSKIELLEGEDFTNGDGSYSMSKDITIATTGKVTCILGVV